MTEVITDIAEQQEALRRLADKTLLADRLKRVPAWMHKTLTGETTAVLQLALKELAKQTANNLGAQPMAPEHIKMLTGTDGRTIAVTNRLFAIVQTPDGSFWSLVHAKAEGESREAFLALPMAHHRNHLPFKPRVLAGDFLDANGDPLQHTSSENIRNTDEWGLGATIGHAIGQTAMTMLVIGQRTGANPEPVTHLWYTTDPAVQGEIVPILPEEWCPHPSATPHLWDASFVPREA